MRQQHTSRGRSAANCDSCKGLHCRDSAPFVQLLQQPYFMEGSLRRVVFVERLIGVTAACAVVPAIARVVHRPAHKMPFAEHKKPPFAEHKRRTTTSFLCPVL